MLLVVLSGCADDEPESEEPAGEAVQATKRPDPLTIAFMKGAAADPREKGWLEGAKLAAEESSKDLGEPVRIIEQDMSGTSLAGLTDDAKVIGALTSGGAGAIGAAKIALGDSMFPVIELADDLYEAKAIRDSVFQAATPHSWQAFRMARYFGPGDRGYTKVGLLREPGGPGDAAASALVQELALRKVALVDAPVGTQSGIASLKSAAVQAVVIEGSSAYRKEALGLLSDESLRYKGRDQTLKPWRPQPMLFEAQLADGGQIAGMGATGDYGISPPGSLEVESVGRFHDRFRARYGRSAGGHEVVAYDGVKSLTKAFAEARESGKSVPGHQAVLEKLERFDRVRLGHLPISLGPDDHVLPERDLLGIWTIPAAPGGTTAPPAWTPLMRTFTADLKRTNVLEEDWRSFFPGADPKGEAPFFHQSKLGIVTDKEDPLH